MPTKTTTPPADAVAKDPHWASSLERLRARQRPTRTLTICDDQGVKQELLAAQLDAQDASDTVAQKRLVKAQAAFDAAAIVLRFQALTRRDMTDLKAAHPPTEEQAEDGMVFNIDTFAPALIAAASLDGITPEDATAFLETWSDGEADALFSAAWSVQSDTGRLDLGKG